MEQTNINMIKNNPSLYLKLNKQTKEININIYNNELDKQNNKIATIIKNIADIEKVANKLCDEKSNSILACDINDNQTISLVYKDYNVEIDECTSILYDHDIIQKYPNVNDLVLLVMSKTKEKRAKLAEEKQKQRHDENKKKANRQKSLALAGAILTIGTVALTKYLNKEVNYNDLIAISSSPINDMYISETAKSEEEILHKKDMQIISPEENALDQEEMSNNQLEKEETSVEVSVPKSEIPEINETIDSKQDIKQESIDQAKEETTSLSTIKTYNNYSEKIHQRIVNSDYYTYIAAYANYYGIDSNVIVDIISQESNGMQDITNSFGCVGLGQLNSNVWVGAYVYLLSAGTDVQITSDNIMNPEIQIATRTDIIKTNLDLYHGNLLMAIQSGVGEGNMKRSISAYSNASGLSEDEIKYNPAIFPEYAKYYERLENSGYLQSSDNADYAIAVLNRSIPGEVLTTEYDGTLYNYCINSDNISISTSELTTNKGSR